jgi:7-keto-8-aminopelargonate synthetase-like enzyme
MFSRSGNGSSDMCKERSNLAEPTLGGTAILRAEAEEFARMGTAEGFANPQSMSDGPFDSKYLTVNGKSCLDLTRLDYLSLGRSDLVRSIMKSKIQEADIGCPASQMVMKSASTVRLEEAIASLHHTRQSIVFTSGYPANENTLMALGLRMNTPHLLPYVRTTKMGQSSMKVPTVFFVDEEAHFSAHHAIRLAKLQARDRCFAKRFPSGDCEKLVEEIKASIRTHGEAAVRIIVSDTLSSVSGKIFAVDPLCRIAEEYDCLLYLDEAHAIGSLGTEGQGVASGIPDFDRYKDRIILMGTLTKAVAQLGGYVTMESEALSWLLRGCSPQYIFSAPLPPWMAESVVEILDLIRGECGSNERGKLATVAAAFRDEMIRQGFSILGSNSHIVPVATGDDEKSEALKTYLEDEGFLSALFIYPAVPRGSSLVRFSFCSDVTLEEVERLAKCLVEARNKIGGF